MIDAYLYVHIKNEIINSYVGLYSKKMDYNNLSLS